MIDVIMPTLFSWESAGGSGSTTTTVIAASAAVASMAFVALARWMLYPDHGKVIPSPLKTLLPSLAPDEIARLEYKPDDFPGARDVETPYGSIRVYEFGPETGRKVLMVHGISTSCQTLGPIATELVAVHGCRVMLFDLFGRGFSDGVGDVPHDARLYVSQMLMALASSPLAWTGDGALDLVGYSLGGGIAVHFAAAFPRLVRRLVLLAPAGLIRAERFGTAARFIFQSGLVPARLLAAITRRRLQQPIANSNSNAAKKRAKKDGDLVAAAAAALEPRTDGTAAATNPVEILAAEVDDPNDPANSAHHHHHRPLNERVMAYVRWMITHHHGFVPAFMGCIRAAPLTDQHDAYASLAGRPPRSVCVVLARDDELIDPDDYAADALPLLGGPDHVVWTVVPGGHDFPMTHAADALREIAAFWALSAADETSPS